jgi:hypothetical protein
MRQPPDRASGRLLADHNSSQGSILPRLAQITFTFLLLLAFWLPFMV